MSHTRVLSQRIRGKSTRRAENVEENIPIDLKADPKENLKTILTNISAQSGVSSGRKLGHLNNLVKLLCTRNDILNTIDLKILMTCIKPALVCEVKEVRAACIRALRYLINDSSSSKIFTELNLDYLVVKCIDISHFNEVERIQALRLFRKIIHVIKSEKSHGDAIPRSLISCIIAISSDGAEERDRVYRTCLAVLCELAITQPILVVKYGGLLALFRAVPECHLYPRISECLVLSIVHIFNNLDNMHIYGNMVNLDPLFSSYTDLLYHSRNENDEIQIREEEMRFVACKSAIVSAIRNWSGLTYLAQGNGLKAFFSAMSVPNSNTCRGILSVLFEVFYIPEPEWTNDFAQALKTANPNVFQESWRLSNSFIAAEAKALLPLRNRSCVDLLQSFTSLLLALFIKEGIIENLIKLAITSKNNASVSSCLLLGGILHLCGKLLPANLNTFDKNKISIHRECLPFLLSHATDTSKTKQERLAAVTTASRLEEIKKVYNESSKSYSLYLEELLFRSKNYINFEEEEVFIDDGITLASSQFSHVPTSSVSRRSSTAHSGSFTETSETSLSIQPTPKKNKSLTLIRDFAEERILAKIKDTQVLNTKENKQWKWKAILSVLNNTFENSMSRQYLYDIINNDSIHRFFKRLVYFYLPSSKLFSSLELARESMVDHNKDVILTGCRLLRFLLQSSQEGLNLLTSLVAQIVEYLSNEATSSGIYKKSADSIGTTCSREYFLLLGVLSSDILGDKILSALNCYKYFESLVTETTHENIIKLLISSLQYSEYGPSRQILHKVLTKCSEPCRLYATSFLRCLYRADVPEFIHWGTELITTQLYDASNAVAMEALNILDEVCDETEYLKSVVNLRPSVLHMGERGAMLVCRFLAYPTGPSYLSDGTYLVKELERWWSSAKLRYVEQVEELLNVSLTSFEKPTNGNSFIRRSNVKKSKCPVRLPAHLYGELAKYSAGCNVIQRENIIDKLLNILKDELNYISETEELCTYLKGKEINKHLLALKSCLWGLSHISSTNEGFDLTNPYGLCKILVELAEGSKWYSIRATCFYCLSLIAQTVNGVEELIKLGWLSVTQTYNQDSESPSIENENITENLSSVSLTNSPEIKEIRSIISKSINKSDGKDGDRECTFTLGPEMELLPSPSPNRKETNNSNQEDLNAEIDNGAAINSGNDLSVYNRSFTKSNSSLSYSSRNLSIPTAIQLDSTTEDVKTNDNLNSTDINFDLISSPNSGISAIYDIRERFQSRSLSFSGNLTSEDDSSDNIKKAYFENVNSIKYIGISIPGNILTIFKSNEQKPHSSYFSSVPTKDLPFLIRGAMHKKHSDKQFLNVDSSTDLTSSKNDSAFLHEVTMGMENQMAIQSEILKLTAKLGSSIGVRMHETALLTIKEKVPEVFNSVSLYNQVSEMLSMYNYRLTTRRFIQELFHGMEMGELFVQAKLDLETFINSKNNA